MTDDTRRPFERMARLEERMSHMCNGKPHIIASLAWLLDHIEAHDTLAAEAAPVLFGDPQGWRHYHAYLKECHHDVCARSFRAAVRHVGELIARKYTRAELTAMARDAAFGRG